MNEVMCHIIHSCDCNSVGCVFCLTAFLCVVLTKKEILQKHLSESTAPGKIDHTWLDVRGFIVYEHPV